MDNIEIDELNQKIIDLSSKDHQKTLEMNSFIEER
jgi:hypothetical protein